MGSNVFNDDEACSACGGDEPFRLEQLTVIITAFVSGIRVRAEGDEQSRADNWALRCLRAREPDKLL